MICPKVPSVKLNQCILISNSAMLEIDAGKVRVSVVPWVG